MLKTKRIIEVLKGNSKYSKKIDMANEIKDVLDVDSVPFNQILDKLNSRKMNAYELVQVEGFFSEFGCLETPMTFTKIQAINEGMNYIPNAQGDMERIQKTLMTPPLLPSVYPDEIENYKLGFLYSTHENNFKIETLDSKHICINEYNKFVPFLIDSEMYYKHCQKYVRMIAEIVPLNEQMIDTLMNIEDKELKEVISYFTDEYYPFITSFILVCKYIEDVNKVQYKLNRTISFTVEYEISNPNITENVIRSKFMKAYKVMNDYNLPISFKNDDTEIWCNSKEGIQVRLRDNYIGFYKEIHPDNLSEYRKDMENIEHYINEFLSKLKLRCQLNYISDYRRKKIYEFIAQ